MTNYLITGGASGIGRAVSTTLLKCPQNKVVILDVNEQEIAHLNKKLTKLFADQQNFLIVKCDVAIPSDIDSVMPQIHEFVSGHLDCLVNNARYMNPKNYEFDSLSLETWNNHLAVELSGPMLMTQKCLPLLKKTDTRSRGGSVVMISSVRARQSAPDIVPYSTTKAGLLGLTQSLCVSLKKHNISVNAILPGYIEVTFENEYGDENGVTWEDRVAPEAYKLFPSGRAGKAEDIRKTIEYLVDAKDFISGSEIVVDGGIHRILLV